MKYSITPGTSLSRIPREADQVHLVRALPPLYLEKLLDRCRINQITMSKSTFRRMGEKSKKICKDRDVAISIEENRGRAIEINMQKLVKIISMYRDDKSYREIEEEMRIPKSTAHYLVRYAERTKIKDGEDTVYLQRMEP